MKRPVTIDFFEKDAIVNRTSLAKYSGNISPLYLSIILCFHTVIGYQIFLSDINNLLTGAWFQEITSNTKFIQNYMV